MSKCYPLNQSPFFRLRNKTKLAEVLQLRGAGALLQLVTNGKYTTVKKGGKIFTPPVGSLRRTHDRVQLLLSRLELPDYLHSGRKHRSNVTNALAHRHDHGMVKTDIRSFFPSTPEKYVADFFRRDLECSGDISSILARLLTRDGAIPKGSPCSTTLAFWANKRMFDELHKIVSSAKGTMTVYVDDISISMDGLNRRLLQRANGVIERYGYEHHKHRVYRGSQNKIVTGVVLNKGRLRAPKNMYLRLPQTKASSNPGGLASYVEYVHKAKKADKPN